MHYKMKIALSHLSFDFVIQSLMNIGTSKLQLACTNAGRKTTVNILYYKGGVRDEMAAGGFFFFFI